MARVRHRRDKRDRAASMCTSNYAGKDKRTAVFSFAIDFKLSRGSEKQFKARDQIAQSMVGRDSVEREARAVVDNFKVDAVRIRRCR
jgi:hypothetical protein